MPQKQKEKTIIKHGIGKPENHNLSINSRATLALNQQLFLDPIWKSNDIDPAIKAKALVYLGRAGEAYKIIENDSRDIAWPIHVFCNLTLGTPLKEPKDNSKNSSFILEGLLLTGMAGGKDIEFWKDLQHKILKAKIKDPLNWKIPFLEGKLFNYQRKNNNAIACLKESVRLNPTAVEPLFLLATLLVDKGLLDETKDIQLLLKSIQKNHPSLILLQAQINFIKEKNWKNIHLMRQKWFDPLNSHRLSLEISSLLIKRKFKRANNLFKIYTKNNSSNSYLHERVLKIVSKMTPRLKTKICKQGLLINPHSPLLSQELAFDLWRTGNDLSVQNALKKAHQNNPFSQEIANAINLLKEMKTWESIETNNFILQFPASEKLFANRLSKNIEKIRLEVIHLLKLDYTKKTVIDILPDRSRFGVRVANRPDFLYTMAACTGPIIALESPRLAILGEHYGPYDFKRVFKHEYAHTIILEHSKNHAPRWLNEGLAQWCEMAPRSEETWKRLKEASLKNKFKKITTLSDLIIKPKSAQDITHGYEQGYWVIEWLLKEYGLLRIHKMLDCYAKEKSNEEVFQEILGINQKEFDKKFTDWSRKKLDEIHLPSFLSNKKSAFDANLLEEINKNKWSESGHLAIINQSGTVSEDQLVFSLRFLDARTNINPIFASQISEILRNKKKYPDASTFAERAVDISPFNASLREMAAASAIQNKDFSLAEEHLKALETLEPNNPIHKERLRALYLIKQ